MRATNRGKIGLAIGYVLLTFAFIALLVYDDYSMAIATGITGFIIGIDGAWNLY